MFCVEKFNFAYPQSAIRNPQNNNGPIIGNKFVQGLNFTNFSNRNLKKKIINIFVLAKG
jgi:hypothetical protein